MDGEREGRCITIGLIDVGERPGHRGAWRGLTPDKAAKFFTAGTVAEITGEWWRWSLTGDWSRTEFLGSLAGWIDLW